MPGPGPHMMYALTTGQAICSISSGRFSPHHSLVYSINAFFGPDLGSFTQWLAWVLGSGQGFAALVERLMHHPFYYPIIMGLPLSFLYEYLSRLMIRRNLLDSVSGVALTRKQCLLLITAGSLSHFFLDHLFEENGRSSMYLWIMSTGWWESLAPITLDVVVVIGSLCIALMCGFIYINRVQSPQSFRNRSNYSLLLILIIAGLYAKWCAIQIFFTNPRRPAVGEEADLGIIVFMGMYFFLPHWLCIMSMNTKDHLDSVAHLPS